MRRTPMDLDEGVSPSVHNFYFRNQKQKKTSHDNTTTSSGQQILFYEQTSTTNTNAGLPDFITHPHNKYYLNMSAPRFVTKILTAICVAPIFDFSTRRNHAPIPPTLLFTEAFFFQEGLTISHHDEHSTFRRMVKRSTETLKECVDDLNYVAKVLLRENQGLLVLLIGGISTMALALVAGLDGVSGFKAVVLSITCYGVTTVLVARSARRIVNQQTAMLLSQKPKLSSAAVTRIVEAIPEENFVRNKYNDTCCICLSTFVRDERIRVLPNCRHEFHRCCIEEWAQTFAAEKGMRLRLGCHVKSGNPTCPLCKTCL